MSRDKYKLVREKIYKDLELDLIGPAGGKHEILFEKPAVRYLIGMLHPQDTEIAFDDVDETEYEVVSEKDEENAEIDKGSYDINEDYSESDEEVEDEKIKRKKYKLQSSIGLSFYINKRTEKFMVNVSWGEYEKGKIAHEGKEKTVWKRRLVSKSIEVDITDIPVHHKIPIQDNINLAIVKHNIKGTNNFLVSIYVVNERETEKGDIIYQVEMEVYDPDHNEIFMCENLARKDKDRFEEFIYRNKPVFSRGFGCAATWAEHDIKTTSRIMSKFIPKHELPSISTKLRRDKENGNFDPKTFSIKGFAEETNKDKLIASLNVIPKRYKYWIDNLPLEDVEDKEMANLNISNCQKSLERIERGVNLIQKDSIIRQAFQFMNKVMHMQASMKAFSRNNNTTLETELQKEHIDWRPFQLAFILMNIEGVTSPLSIERNIVDLLWFPTGGGKTEAYLGIAAFLLGYRRLTASSNQSYNKDGGVTIFLRYTLRLLTTQQRDRLLKMICAAEILRATNTHKIYGKSEFSVGFWVGGQVTPNKFDEVDPSNQYNSDYDIKKRKNNLIKQVIECPCCGNKKLDHQIDLDKGSVEIKCLNKKCYFSTNKIPVYLVDEEIYRKTPSVIISTVDKFARMPWDEKTALLFGKTDRYCERHGYIGWGEEEHKDHRKKANLPASKVNQVRPFYPPELIIQDELHLITGPLGTIYGGYETAVEELCSIEEDGKVIKPKYVVSTATIKNAGMQIEKLYARKQYSQFPPPGLSIDDSFFAKEESIEKYPFRLYTGICAPGHSMKTTLLRVYAVLLQSTENLLEDNELKDYIDPYRTLVGYFNSIRELGGAVRLLDDDIKKRLNVIKNLYGFEKQRYIRRTRELTSRIASYDIPKVLEELENKTSDSNMLDVVLATNMISVGMDVDRLGLMVVTGQPKLTSEYIQATSRVGRSFPGLVITMYNPYRPRDLSHYEDFKGYHQRLYNHVEGTTATPFAARARERVLHAIVIALLRLENIMFSQDEHAKNIKDIKIEDIDRIKEIIKKRVQLIEHRNVDETIEEINSFIDNWKILSMGEKKLVYYFYKASKNGMRKAQTFNRLLSFYSEKAESHEIPTLSSMREIENTSKLYIYDEEGY